MSFPFVTMPPINAMRSSLRHLTILGALEVQNRSALDKLLASEVTSDPTSLTELGGLLSKLPLAPRFAKMMIVSMKYQVLRYTIMIVSCLSVSELFKEVALAETQQPEITQADTDPDLLTTLDIQRQEKRQVKAQKEAARERTKE